VLLGQFPEQDVRLIVVKIGLSLKLIFFKKNRNVYKKAFKSKTNHPSDKVATAANFLRKWTESGMYETEAVMNRDLKAVSQCFWDGDLTKNCIGI